MVYIDWLPKKDQDSGKIQSKPISRIIAVFYFYKSL